MVEIRLRNISYWRGNEFVIMDAPVIVYNGRCYAHMKDKKLHLVAHSGRILAKVLKITPDVRKFCSEINLELV